MNKQITRLCWEIIYIVLGGVGLLLSTHLFTDHVFSRDFYVYYTNLSNIYCLVVMIVCFAKNLKVIKQGKPFQNGRVLQQFKFVGAVLIAITFLVFNVLLSDYSLDNYFLNLYNLLFHVFLPIIYSVYVLTDCKDISWWTPFVSLAVQFVYVAFVLIRAQILQDAPNRLLYPYFFLNIQTLGWLEILKWVFIMTVCSLAVGYIFFWIVKRQKKSQQKNTQ